MQVVDEYLHLTPYLDMPYSFQECERTLVCEIILSISQSYIAYQSALLQQLQHLRTSLDSFPKVSQ